MGSDDAPWLPPHLTILTAHHCEEKPQEIFTAESDNGVRVLNAPPFIDVPTTSKFTTGHSTLMGEEEPLFHLSMSFGCQRFVMSRQHLHRDLPVERG